MGRPRLLDLFCGAGGAAMGYHRAGFDVVGVDIKPQPRYPFAFIRADATDPPLGLGAFDAIHASPPCQDHMRARTWNAKTHGTGWMLAAARTCLIASGVPWVIENVPGAAIAPHIRLCGCQFGLPVRSERWFETSWQAFDLLPPHDHRGQVLNRFRSMHGPYFREHGHVPTRRQVAAALGVEWMSGDEHQQAIPPAYTEYIGRQLLAEIGASK